MPGGLVPKGRGGRPDPSDGGSGTCPHWRIAQRPKEYRAGLDRGLAAASGLRLMANSSADAMNGGFSGRSAHGFFTGGQR
jgi:hypothetical protein